jgi:hypothetical protein
MSVFRAYDTVYIGPSNYKPTINFMGGGTTDHSEYHSVMNNLQYVGPYKFLEHYYTSSQNSGQVLAHHNAYCVKCALLLI